MKNKWQNFTCTSALFINFNKENERYTSLLLDYLPLSVNIVPGQLRLLRFCRRPTIKFLIFWHPKNCCNSSKNWTMWLYHSEMRPKNADWIANSVDPDQTEQSDLGLDCLPWAICLKTKVYYGNSPAFCCYGNRELPGQTLQHGTSQYMPCTAWKILCSETWLKKGKPDNHADKLKNFQGFFFGLKSKALHIFSMAWTVLI